MIVPGIGDPNTSSPMAQSQQKQLSPSEEVNVLMAAAIMKQHGRFDQPDPTTKKAKKAK